MWIWIVIGVGAFLVPLLVSLGLAAILGTISRQISELHQTDDWATLPPTRALVEPKEQHAQEQAQSPPADWPVQRHSFQRSRGVPLRPS